jgi:hypothetical protein
MTDGGGKRAREFHITVLGRTLEHLGSQMYKRRDVAITELVANCWDAGATEVALTIPVPASYDATTSLLTVTDNGSGMTEQEVDDSYLVIGRNRRAAGQPDPQGRRVMGRKGVGKLAGFGLAGRLQMKTWRDGWASTIELDAAALKTEQNSSKTLLVPGTVGPAEPSLPYPSGTKITMTALKHKTPPDIDGLHRALARRFSRTVRGAMEVTINGETLREPVLDLHLREPASGVATEDLGGGRTVTWWAGFSKTVLPPELQGFTVLVHDKTAQAPPYFFAVEGTASGQHGTKYLTGVIEADYLDDGIDDDSDRVSTDRQEIDWDDEEAAPLKEWGDRLTRRLLRARTEQREKAAESHVNDDPELRERLEKLDAASADQVRKFVRALGAADTDDEKVRPLADTILRAFEYRQFHDFIGELDALAAEPEQLEMAVEYLRGWKVLESRAILEVIKGRLDIVDKFHSMIVNDATETASVVGNENLHDLIADYPWLINPEWQVLAEERTLSKQLQEWGAEDTPQGARSRYDFIALEGGGETIVIEIKRSGHAVELKDLQQIERYVDRLGQARENIRGAFITGDRYALAQRTREDWDGRDNIELLTWAQVHERTRSYYQHYRAVLDSDIRDPHFDRKQREIARTRSVLESGAYRGRAERADGLGPQDASPASGNEK